VLRGGAWNNDSTNCRSAYRNNNTPDNRNNNYGLRLVRAPKCRNSGMGIPGESLGESSSVPVMAVRPSSKQKTGRRGWYRALPGNVKAARQKNQPAWGPSK